MDAFSLATIALELATEATSAQFATVNTTETARRGKQRPAKRAKRRDKPPHATTGWPCALGTLPELPCVPPLAADMHAAHGVANNELHELDDITALRPLSFENAPAKTKVNEAGPTQPHTDFRPDSPNDLFTTFKFHPRVHGKWVRRKLAQYNKGKPRNLRKRTWTVQGDHMWKELLDWFRANALDIRMAEDIASKTSGSINKWRPLCALWIIPKEVLVPKARGII